MKRYHLTAAIVLSLGTRLNAQVADTSTPPSEWRAFRRTYPFHTQTVAVGRVQPDSSRLLVISEPPPNVTLAAIQSIDSARLARARAFRYRVGHDGWVKDVVATLPPISSAQLAELVAGIHLRLFGTTYKAEAIRLDSLPPATYIVPRADVAVRFDELHQWLLDDDAIGFRQSPRAANAPLRTILRDGRTGVYHADESGLVGWVFPRTGSLTAAAADIRQFAIDSDLLIGAVANDSSVAVIARARRVPLHVLPPLRVESVLLLAAAPTDHLAQSYERTFLLAGTDGTLRDWAPIYLSPLLQDTEYGSLLNITDQLLKSWSQAGTVSYVNFRYPQPSSYPFPIPLDSYLNSEQVTFNWNTAGAGYTVTDGALTVYAINRTGALPVSYFAGNGTTSERHATDAESTAYNYFSNSGDPNLIRVVQYAALYQIFRAFRPAPASGLPPAPSYEMAALRDIVYETLERIRRIDTLKLTARVPLEDRGALWDAKRAVSDLYEIGGPRALDRVVSRILAPRGDGRARRDSIERSQVMARVRTGQYEPDDRTKLAIWRAERAVRHPIVRGYIPEALRDSAQRTYVRAAGRRESEWVRTASIVLSWSTDSINPGVGGHNLDATVTRFRASESTPVGRPRTILDRGELVIVANPRDIPRHVQRLRAIATGASREQIEATLSSVGGGRIPPPRSVAAAIGDWPERGRGSEWDPPSSGAQRVGYAEVGRPFTPDEAALVASSIATREPNVSITKRADESYEILIAEAGQLFEAFSMTALTEAVADHVSAIAGRAPPRVYLTGFTQEDATVVVQNVEGAVRQIGVTRARGNSGELAAGGRGGGGGRNGSGRPTSSGADDSNGKQGGGGSGRDGGNAGRESRWAALLKLDDSRASARARVITEGDLSRTTVRSVAVTADPVNPQRAHFEFEFHVPAQRSSSQSFAIRLTGWVRSGANAIKRLSKEALASLFQRAFEHSADPATEIRAGLRAAGADVESIDVEIFDMRIVLHPDSNANGPVRAHVAE